MLNHTTVSSLFICRIRFSVRLICLFRLSSERLQAQQAALLLRIAEKSLLDDAMQAVDCAVRKQE